MEGGDALIAKYKGPYNRIALAYAAISDWLIKQKKQCNDKPFEVYLNDPLEVKDPFELRTDVYQLIK
jgi:effector-binding domain-containing protein